MSEFLGRWPEGEPVVALDAAVLCVELRGLRDIAEHYDDDTVVAAVDAIAGVFRELHRGRDTVSRLDDEAVLVVLNAVAVPEAMYLALRAVDQLRSIRIPGAELCNLACVAVICMATGIPLPTETLRNEVHGVSGTERVRIMNGPRVAPLPAFRLPEQPGAPAPSRVNAFR